MAELPEINASSIDVVIFQMGKVASTAILEALKRRGVAAVQAHIASPGRLAEKLHTIANPTLDEATARRVYQDFLIELQAMYTISRARAAGTAAVAGEPLRLLTPVRDPLNWYWSHFVEMYGYYQTLLNRYWAANHSAKDRFDPAVAYVEVLEKMFQLLANTDLPLDRAEHLGGLQRLANESDPSQVVASQINRFLLPLRWMEEDFLSATGVDVYAHDFNLDAGITRLEAGGFSILLLRYEGLQELLGRVAEFCSLDTLSLEQDNVSSDKPLPFNPKILGNKVLQAAPQGLVQKLYSSKYACHFGYRPPAASSAD